MATISNTSESSIVSLKKTNMAKIFTIFKNSDSKYMFNLNDTITLDTVDSSENYFSYHTVSSKESYHTISFNYYNTTRLWWLITKFNNIENVIDLPTVGTSLKILNQTTANLILSQLKN